MGSIRIDVLGASFKVHAAEEEEYLQRLLSYYRDITAAVEKSSKLSNPLEISILSGITLVDELYKEKRKNASLEKKLLTPQNEAEEELTRSMIDSLSAALEENSEE